METLQNILIDSLNGFSIRFIPLFLFQLLIAGLLGHLFQKIINRKSGEQSLQFGALIAMSVALLTAMVKYSLPFAVMAAAVILLLRPKKEYSFIQVLGLFLVTLVGVGCGIGSVIQTGIGFVLLATVILFTPLKND
jgi:hypothetical protein